MRVELDNLFNRVSGHGTSEAPNERLSADSCAAAEAESRSPSGDEIAVWITIAP